MKKESYRIPDMHCEGCAKRVTTVLERLEGVRSADVSFDDKTAQVEYDEDAVGHDEMRDAVEKAGYTMDGEPA